MESHSSAVSIPRKPLSDTADYQDLDPDSEAHPTAHGRREAYGVAQTYNTTTLRLKDHRKPVSTDYALLQQRDHDGQNAAVGKDPDAKASAITSHAEVDEHGGYRHSVKAKGRLSGWLTRVQRLSLSWTSKGVLLLFCAANGVILVVIVVLLHLSNVQHGFVVPRSISPYTWKYGPTAVLTIMLAFWRQVDRRTRICAPWHQMEQGYSTARSSVLLDYVSPILPVAVVSSVRNRHWHVTATIGVFGLTKLAILFSTGLLVVQDVVMVGTGQAMTLKALGGSVNNGTATDFYLQEYYANLEYGLAYPPGVTDTAAFQEPLGYRMFPSGSTVTADVLAFFPSLDCVQASIQVHITLTESAVDGIDGPIYSTAIGGIASFDTQTCYGNISLYLPGCSYHNWSDCQSKKLYSGTTSFLACDSFDKPPNNPGQNNAILFSLIEIVPDNGITKNAGAQIPWATAVLCRPNYSIEKAKLTVDVANPQYPQGKSLSVLTTSRNLIADYPPSNLTDDLLTTMSGDTDISPLFSKGMPISNAEADYTGLTTPFSMMSLIHAGQMDDFQNSTVLEASAEAYVQGIAAQMVGGWLSFPNNLTTTGDYTYKTQRLRVQPIAVYEMCTVNGVAIVILVLLVWIGHENQAHSSPLVNLAAGCSKDGDIARLLGDAGSMTDKQLLRNLSEQTFTTSKRTPGRWSLHCKNVPTAVQDSYTSSTSAQKEWWTPMSGHLWFNVICVALPLFEIVVLEVLQRVSNAHQGIADSRYSPTATRNMVAVLSAGVMLGTAALYSCVEWATITLVPYFSMKRRPSRLQHIDYDPYADLPPISIVRSIWRGQLPAAIIIFASLSGSLLTIVVSGLYGVETLPKAHDTVLQTVDQFNPSWNRSGNTATDLIFELMHTNGLNYPTGVYDTFVYPTLIVNATGKDVEGIVTSLSSTKVDTTLNVLRASLNCSFVPQNHLSYGLGSGTTAYNDTVTLAELNATIDLPAHCAHSTGIWQNASQMMTTFTIESPEFDPDIMQGAISLLMPPGWAYGEINSYYPPYCPSIAFIIGKFANDTSTDDKTVMICNQYQEELPIAVTFNMPELLLNTTTPPFPNESAAKTVSGVQYHFNDIYETSGDFYSDASQYYNVSLGDMIGDANQARFFNITQRLYSAYMALLISDVMRVDATTINATNNVPTVSAIGTQYTATIYDPNRTRIFQNNTSKVVLQALLATMVVCFLVARSMVGLRRVVPHNPCSIAGAMSLLVGSELAEEVARYMKEDDHDDADLQELMKDTRLRMTWWQNGELGHTRFGIDKVAS